MRSKAAVLFLLAAAGVVVAFARAAGMAAETRPGARGAAAVQHTHSEKAGQSASAQGATRGATPKPDASQKQGAAGQAGAQGQSSGAKPRVLVVDPDMGADSLPARKKAQVETAKKYGVFHDFTFAGKLQESGITLVHKVVQDAARTYNH